jgi:drug/metabolite transporter (DMT)-like permease
VTTDAPTLRRRLIYLGLVLLFCMAWASGFTAAKIAIQTAPPALFGGIRFILTGGALLGYAAIRGHFRGRVPWASLIFLGAPNQAGYQGLAWQGMGTVSAGLATIIASLNPILVAAVAAPLLGEPLHWRKVLGLLLGFAGVAFVVRHRIVAGGEDPTGVLMVVGALLALVAGTLAFKRLAPAVTLPVAVGVQALSAGTLLFVLGLVFEDPGRIDFGPQFWLVMGWCILVMSIGALLLWFWLLSHGTASSASALHFLIPPIGLAMSWLVLGERVSPSDLLGIVPVALGIWLATRPAPLGAPDTCAGGDRRSTQISLR